MSTGRVGIVVAVALLACAPGVASGHNRAATDAEHAAEDAAVHGAAAEAGLQRRTREATAEDARAAVVAAAGPADQVGAWGPVTNWPVVGVHVALMPNGKVLAYDSVGDKATETYAVHDFTRATIWDPASGTHTPVNVQTGFNIFCSGLAHTMSGQLFTPGGNKDSSLNGIRQTHIFDAATNAWTRGPDMVGERWYPSVTPLANGELLITEGGPDMPEVRRTDGSLRSLSSASLNLPLYPWMDTAPDGRAFLSGPGTTMRKLDTSGTGAWTSVGTRDAINRDYGSRALFDTGKLLVAGGGGSSRDARVIDFNGATPQVSATAPMANGRRQHNLTVLADGSVLATGGNSSGAGLVDLNAGVYAAERWNPATGTWTTLAAESVTRQYHSTALLLADGRVLSSGGGICGTCDSVGYLAKNAQVFTPPYLFRPDGSGALATRPAITGAPAAVGYGGAFTITTPDAAAIRKVALARLGAVTHSVDMEQRYVPLAFTAGAGSLTVSGPATANIAPPGVYMVFLTDAAGVPSVSTMVTVRAGTSPPPPPPPTNTPPSVGITAPADGATLPWKATLDVTATATDSDGTVARVEFLRNGTKVAEDTTAPYAWRWKNAASGTYTLTARALDNAGAATTSAPVRVTVSRR